MSELLTLQDLANGHLDVKALGEAANGDENTIVTTRTGNTYPSAKKAIKTMFENGGFPAAPFATKALMTTSSLADGDYAWVTDDTDANNGLYIKKSGVWVFSEFNVLKRVQDYVKRLDAKVMVEDASYLDVALDKNGEAYRYTDASGELHVTGLNKSGSVQSNINTLHTQSKNIPTFNQDDRLHNFTDKADNVFAFFDKDTNLQLTGDIYKNGVLITDSDKGEVTAAQVSHQGILLQQPKIKTLVDVATQAEDGLRKRMAFAITTPTGLVYLYHKQIAGFDGDLVGSELWKAIITIDAELNTTVVSRELFLAPDEPRGIVKHPTLGRTSDGRIILMFEKRLEISDPYTRYQCYSSDEGLTFTTPTLVSPTGLNPAGQGGSALGTTGEILAAKNGRLVVPMYTTGGTPFAMYSDDDGVNWVFSDYVRKTSGDDWVEPSITLDTDTNILMDMRPFRGQGVRGRAISYDNGETWEYLGASTLLSATNQGTIFKDGRIGALIQTHNATGTDSRTKYSLSLSYDNDKSYPYRYQPFEDSWYGGYSQILKWSEGVYIVIIEYADTYVSVNNNENVGLLILSLSEVLSNVSHN